jgi:hypothetical protein
MLYHYQEKRKLVEYKRLKILLNLSDSNPDGSVEQSSFGNIKPNTKD